MAEALSHLTVVELCDEIPGAFCGRQLAAWGARVVAVEPPGGSPLRAAPPVVAGRDGSPISCLWEFLAAGKETLRADVAVAGGEQTIAALLQRADLLVTDWTPARLADAGVDLATLTTALPALVVVRLTPFGADGPYAAYQGTDLIVQALSGFMSVNGSPDAPPLKAPANIVPYTSGMQALIGALAALWERERGGAAQVVHLSELEATATLVPFLRTQYWGGATPRQGGSYSGARLYRCRDGYLSFSPHTERGWQNLLLAFELDEAAVPEPIRTPEGRRDWPAVRRFVGEQTAERSAEALFHTLNQLGLPCGILRTPRELLDDPHLCERAFFFRVDHPEAGPLTFAGPAARMSETPMAVPTPAREYVDEPAPARAAPARRPRGEADQPGAGPLAGLRVVDLTQAWIGPYATMLLADLGADVIKIESHRRPDVWRGEGGAGSSLSLLNPRAHPWNVNANFNSVNRNKRGLALDLNTEGGKEVFLRLVERADLVIENFTPRVLANFGLGYERLRQVKPDLVMLSFSGYGAGGPYRDYKANGATTEAIAGWDALLGYPGGPPMMLGAMEADPISGLQMAALSLVALLYRDQTAVGQRIEGSMFEAAAGYIGEEVLRASVAGGSVERLGNRHPAMAPHGVFPAAGEDEWLAIAVRNDAEWRSLADVVGGAFAGDPRLTTLAGRQAAAQEIETAIGRWTATLPARAAMERLQEAGVPAAPVLRTDQVLEDPHFAARGWFKPITHPDLGTHLYNGFPWRFSRTPPVCHTPPPRVGEHSAAVLAAELGMTDVEISALVENGVTGSVLERPV